MSQHIDRGRVLLGIGQSAKAETEFRRSLVEDPDDPIAHALLAESLNAQDKAARATTEAQKAIGLDPELDVAYAALARSLRLRGLNGEALEAIGRAISLNPSDADHRVLRAFVLANLRRAEESLEEVNAALSLDPRNSTALAIKPSVLRLLRRREEADAASLEALHQHADDAKSHVARGWVLLEQGNATEARAHFRDALRLDPNNAAAVAGLKNSIKATSLFYRWFLAYLFHIRQFLWARFSRADAEDPASLTRVLCRTGRLLLFAFVMSIVVPISNLALRLHPDGRLTLNKADKRASNLMLVCLAAIAISVGLSALLHDKRWMHRAICFAVLTPFVSASLMVPRGSRLKTFVAVCSLAAWLILCGLLTWMALSGLLFARL